MPTNRVPTNLLRLGLVAVAALVLLASFWISSLRRGSAIARLRFTRQSMLYVVMGAHSYINDCGVPGGEADLIVALLHDPGEEGWSGPYLQEHHTRDAWRKALRCSILDGVIRISSSGPDLRFGTGDDISDLLGIPDGLAGRLVDGVTDEQNSSIGVPSS